MGYSKKLWEEYKETEYYDFEINKRLSNKKPFGAGGEKEYIDSMKRLIHFISLKCGSNLAIVSTLNEALSKMIKIAENTWKEEWNAEGKKKPNGL